MAASARSSPLAAAQVGPRAPRSLLMGYHRRECELSVNSYLVCRLVAHVQVCICSFRKCRRYQQCTHDHDNSHIDRGSSRSGGCPSHLTATFIHEMLATEDLQRHLLNELQPAYFRRFHKMLQAIQQDLLPLGVTMPQTDRNVAGGYFIWLTLPNGLSAEALAKRTLSEESLVIAPGPLFKVQGEDSSRGMRFESD